VIKSVQELSTPYYVVIGNFDGVHLGHQFLLQQAQELAQQQGCTVVAVTFFPHPKMLFSPSDNFYIFNHRYNRELLKRHCDHLLEIEFTPQCAALEPLAFLNNYIFSSYLKGIVVGYDFLFGRRQQGDGEFLRSYCQQNGLRFHQVGAFALNELTVSSSVVRSKIRQRQFREVDRLLGHSYFLAGNLISGKGLGRKINSPTLNLQYDSAIITPSQGVYATYTQVNGKHYPSVTNIGYNPTVEKQNSIKVETHLLDTKLPLLPSSTELKIFFRAFLREERKFNSLQELQQQIRCDITHAKEELCL
jgi:riboflavin kinase/FMN adenylyltransferase